jgi:hypothetical protein
MLRVLRGACDRGGATSGEEVRVTTLIGAEEHAAERPSWQCRSCGEPWPCDPARDRLAAGMGRVNLSVYMWSSLEEAARDMPDGPPQELFERFIRWTH